MTRLHFLCLSLIVLLSQAGYAQMAGHNTKGDFGMQSGTQAPKGFYVIPMFYDYSGNTLRDYNGDRVSPVPNIGSIDAQATIAGLMWVSDKKIFGGSYGFSIWPAVTNSTLEFPSFEIKDRVSTGFSDLYIQPINIGWNTNRADYIAGLGLYAPTGEYKVDGDSNRGLGMWSYEVFGGTTVYFDDARSWHVSILAAYETHGKKEGTDIRVGDILTLEGGFGKSFMDGDASIGIAYYAQWKMTDDQFEPGFTLPDGRMIKKHRVYGIGPEVTIPLASKTKLFGFLNLRYIWESGARTSLEGETFTSTLTFPIPSVLL